MNGPSAGVAVHDESDLDLRVGTTDGSTADLYRVVDAASLRASDDFGRHRRGLVTGVSIVVVDAATTASQRVIVASDGIPPGMGIEYVLVDPDQSLTERLDQLPWSWSSVTSTAGALSHTGRAAALDRATAHAGGEFIVLPSVDDSEDAGPILERLGEVLGAMWVNGADAMVVDRDGTPGAPDRTQSPEHVVATDLRAERLAAGLGLRGGTGARLVVLRRWVARFLLDELGRAIDPVEELTERVRLLELRLTAVVDRD